MRRWLEGNRLVAAIAVGGGAVFATAAVAMVRTDGPVGLAIVGGEVALAALLVWVLRRFVPGGERGGPPNDEPP